MPRRANHEGSIRQRPDGRWEASIAFAGRRYYRRGKTRAEATRQLNELRAEHATGELVSPSRLTVSDFLGQWLDANRASWRPSTLSGYEGIVRNYLVPSFGQHRLQGLTAPEIARAYSRWRDEGVGKRTLAIIHARLHRALRQAVLWGLISRNPADAVEPPRSAYRRPTLWTPEETARFVKPLSGEQWQDALFALLLGGGLRLGEAVALRWDNLDLALGTATVARTRLYLKGDWIEADPKTRAGVRTVSLPQFAVQALSRWRKRQAAVRLRCGPQWAGEGRVVSLRDGSSPRRWQVGEQLRACAKGLGLPLLRPHDLRHACASLALHEGVSLPDVSHRLGHANVAITAATYAHSIHGSDEHVARALDRALASR